jgi:hypothetical protein
MSWLNSFLISHCGLYVNPSSDHINPLQPTGYDLHNLLQQTVNFEFCLHRVFKDLVMILNVDSDYLFKQR